MEINETITQWLVAFFSSPYIKTGLISVLIVLFAVSVSLLIHKLSGKFESLLQRATSKEKVIIPKLNINVKILLDTFIFFYPGLKLILIIYIIIKSINFLLVVSGLTTYWQHQHLIRGIFGAIAITIVCYYTYKLINIIFKKAKHKLSLYHPKIYEVQRLKSIFAIFEDRIADILSHILSLVHILSIIFIIYGYITLLFSFFTFTSTWSNMLFGWIISPLRQSIQAIIDYLPNVFAIIVIFIVIQFILKVVKMIFNAIENEKITPKNFYKDWAQPTYKIVRFLIIIFGAIVIFPYLPGSESPFFRGISIFIGVLFSLGSSSAISNIVAGVVLTYMRSFREDDIVKIAETNGKVVEKSLLVTRIRTIKNVEITIPNSSVLNSHIINYSSSSSSSSSEKDRHLILHTEVTVGYDVPWKKVHELLIKAALSTDLIIKDETKMPFVYQTALDDNYVKYQINAYTDTPSRMAKIYSDMHQHIQDVFLTAGIDLLSPGHIEVKNTISPTQ
jgi:small-conductance mechanosensitive channel